MRKIGVVLLILLLLLSACNKPMNKVDENTEKAIEALIQTKKESVAAYDSDKLMSILDSNDKELHIEQANWLKDIELNPIDEYNLSLKRLERVSDNVYKAVIKQQYNKNGENHELTYNNKYIEIDGKIYDAGYYFNELKQGNITIKYTAANQKLAEQAIDDMNELFEEGIIKWGITPQRGLVIKLFDDGEAMRQSIKLSMWVCGGWYEYGEALKIYSTNNITRERISEVASHEMTHLFTLEKSGGNLAYWLSEGLATYYSDAASHKTPKELAVAMDAGLLTVDEIEAIELEKLENDMQIMEYYRNANIITSYIIEKYGQDKINEILTELGKLPSHKGTAAENDTYYREYLSQVLPKVLGIKSYEVFKQQWQDEIKNLS